MQGNVLTKLIFINVAVFLVIRLATVVTMLMRIDAAGAYLHFLQMPSAPEALIYRPWTILTYMFVHADFIHILFNMLWMYWFGKIFLQFFSERHLGGLYLMGGIAGGALFILSYNTFPYFRDTAQQSLLMGASASVMAIVFAVSFYQQNYQISLLLIGRIKLIYLALGVLTIDLFSVTSHNAGGHIAHIGGALLGIFFAVRFRKGTDITRHVNRWLDRIINLGKRRPRMRVTTRRRETDMEYNARKNTEMDALNAVLDKLKHSGYESLSADEKRTLFNASKK